MEDDDDQLPGDDAPDVEGLTIPRMYRNPR